MRCYMHVLLKMINIVISLGFFGMTPSSSAMSLGKMMGKVNSVRKGLLCFSFVVNIVVLTSCEVVGIVLVDFSVKVLESDSFFFFFFFFFCLEVGDVKE